MFATPRWNPSFSCCANLNQIWGAYEEVRSLKNTSYTVLMCILAVPLPLLWLHSTCVVVLTVEVCCVVLCVFSSLSLSLSLSLFLSFFPGRLTTRTVSASMAGSTSLSNPSVISMTLSPYTIHVWYVGIAHALSTRARARVEAATHRITPQLHTAQCDHLFVRGDGEI